MHISVALCNLYIYKKCICSKIQNCLSPGIVRSTLCRKLIQQRTTSGQHLCLSVNSFPDNSRAQSDIFTVSQAINSAFRKLESRLSLQEVIVSSFGSLKASLETKIRSLHAKVGKLTEKIEQLEKDRPTHSIPTLDMDSFQPSIEAMINSTVTTLLAEEKEKEKKKTQPHNCITSLKALQKML